jgi:hypothetical protein
VFQTYVPSVPMCSKEKAAGFTNLRLLKVPPGGIEPPRYRYHWILSPARLPIPPQRQVLTIQNHFKKISNVFLFLSAISYCAAKVERVFRIRNR